jgi:hypothetical protein
VGKFDDPFDAAKSQYPEPPDNVPGEVALRIGGAVIPLIGLVNSVRDYYSQRAIQQRLNALTEAVNDKVNTTNSDVDAIKAKLESGQFAEGIRLAIEETWRTTDAEKVNRFGAILGNLLAASDNLDSPQDAAEFIRTVSQLSDRDIQVLDFLCSNSVHLLDSYANLDDPNPFIDVWSEAVRMADEAKLARDDFYSSCKRLEGFGLAIELVRNPSRIKLGEYSFRPTRRGEKLYFLLRDERSKP